MPPTQPPPEDRTPPESQSAPTGQAPPEDSAPAPARPDPRPVLPQRSRDETDAAWGERPEPDDDERLRQERPPHYDQ